MTSLLGHDDPRREWDAALLSERMHHAWLLAGLKGVGKGAFARSAAAALVAEHGVPQPDPASHPDILVLDHLPANDDEERKKAEGKPYQTKRNISVDQIRRMQQRLITRPTLGSRRAVIIDPADDMEKGAVNALLKSLEEPPAGTYFLLVSHRPGRLLPTIRSRCRTLRFAPVENSAIETTLARMAPQADAGARAAAVAAAQGSPGVALEFVEQDLGKVYKLMLAILRDGDERLVQRGALAEEIGARPDRERIAATIDLARAIVSQELPRTTSARQARLIEAHAALIELGGQAPTYNFDPGLLVTEIGGLLARAALPREVSS